MSFFQHGGSLQEFDHPFTPEQTADQKINGALGYGWREWKLLEIDSRSVYESCLVGPDEVPTTEQFTVVRVLKEDRNVATQRGLAKARDKDREGPLTWGFTPEREAQPANEGKGTPDPQHSGCE